MTQEAASSEHPTFNDPATGEKVAILASALNNPNYAQREDAEEPQDAPVLEQAPQQPQDFNAAIEQWFQEKFKASPDEVAERLNRAQVSETNPGFAELSAAWGVPLAETQQRITKVLEYVATLPQEQQQNLEENGTIEDVMALYTRATQRRQQATTIFSRPGQPTVPTTQPKILFTEQQIYDMSDDEYRKNASAIYQAYEQGRVGK